MLLFIMRAADLGGIMRVATSPCLQDAWLALGHSIPKAARCDAEPRFTSICLSRRPAFSSQWQLRASRFLSTSPCSFVSLCSCTLRTPLGGRGKSGSSSVIGRNQTHIIGTQQTFRNIFSSSNCSLLTLVIGSATLSPRNHMYRWFSSESGNASSQVSAVISEPAVVDPYVLVQDDLQSLCCDIKQELVCASSVQLSEFSQYHFDGAGKYFRPLVVMLIARACNAHGRKTANTLTRLLSTQRSVAMIAEMIHTASLVHDDVIDASDMRRGRDTLQRTCGQRKAILTGDYILSVATRLLAQIGNEQVVRVLAQVLEDLVAGEFMQLGSKEDENERFNHYMKKTFKKTASLIANSCRAVAILGGCSEQVCDGAYEYGKNVGIAFQLVDDILDYVSTESILGKPTSADLRLGLATAPVLFAAQQYSEINPLIMRRFTEPGDIALTIELVAKSDGVSHTRYLAEQHTKEAARQILQLTASTEQRALVDLTQKVINRLK